eukprot:591650-Rhodomonas_salina.1
MESRRARRDALSICFLSFTRCTATHTPCPRPRQRSALSSLRSLRSLWALRTQRIAPPPTPRGIRTPVPPPTRSLSSLGSLIAAGPATLHSTESSWPREA